MNKKINEEITNLENAGFTFDYCDRCETSIIICPICDNSSCNGGGCDYCCPFWWPYWRDSAVHSLAKSAYNQAMFERIV